MAGLAAGIAATIWSSVAGEERLLAASLPLVMIAVVLLGPTSCRVSGRCWRSWPKPALPMTAWLQESRS
ncbi:hypothetical protein [Candidatus Poriferisodalis sp.]|uniref:hypothetical protein n=1 Tax=Candidatus Poriferisodalis sp. TaxID=3101277 RepID=UPI003B51B470